MITVPAKSSPSISSNLKASTRSYPKKTPIPVSFPSKCDVSIPSMPRCLSFPTSFSSSSMFLGGLPNLKSKSRLANLENDGFPPPKKKSKLRMSNYFCTFTLPEPLKMDGWKMILSFWVSAYFQGQTVSFREGTSSPTFQFPTPTPTFFLARSRSAPCGRSLDRDILAFYERSRENGISIFFRGISFHHPCDAICRYMYINK